MNHKINNFYALAASALACLLLAAMDPIAGVALAQSTRTYRCGEDFKLYADIGLLPAGGLSRRAPDKTDGTTTIILDAGPGLQSRPEALATWQQAVAIWEAVLNDPVTITIAGDFADLGPNVLGATSSRQFPALYGDVRDALLADASNDESVLAGLPANNLDVELPPGFFYDDRLSATKANFRALGFDMSFDDANPDAIIIFAISYADEFDFDPSDGIDEDKIDFEAVVVHEIGHALGFVSRVDLVDFLRAENESGTIRPSTLDLFRQRSGQGAAGLAGSPRLMLTGDLEPEHVFFDGFGDLGLSTGVYLGDGRQASHWQADELTGNLIGVMDPTLSAGLREELTDNDLRAFGLIGWDVNEPSLSDVPQNQPKVTGATLESIYPNPFNPRTTVAYRLDRASEVRLAIHDLRGRIVRNLVVQTLAAGRHTTVWDGMDDAGRTVPSGIYLVRLTAPGGADQAKIVMTK